MENVGKMGFRNMLDSLPGLSGIVKDDQLDCTSKQDGKMEVYDTINDERRKEQSRHYP